MSNYRRLISYIYAYEGGIKGKNIGFAKIEVRGDQCRIQVNVKKVYVGSNDIGVYLLSPKTELLLGRIFIRGGCGEFRINVNSRNIEGSGLNMDECYGLTVHDVESTWQCYTTIWDDAVTQAAEMTTEVTLEDVTATATPVEQKREEESVQEIPSALPISDEIERELIKEEMELQAIAPWEKETEEMEENDVMLTEEEAVLAEEEVAPPHVDEVVLTEEKVVLPDADDAVLPEEEIVPEEQPVPEEEPVLEAQLIPETQSESCSQQFRGPEDIEKLKELDRLEQEQRYRNRLWDQLQRRYAKVLAFDYDKGCEILSIKPQDIGLLPRDIWVYGNNSFLLHGFYNYRHLILAKLNDPEGSPRYLLGVPGHYFSNEKYMASMFGFPHFVLARKQPDADGRFGYWYTDIRL